MGGEEAVRGDDGDKVDGGEVVAEAVGSLGGSVKDQSVHGESAKSAKEDEAAERKSEDSDEKKDVDGDDATKGSNSEKSLKDGSNEEHEHGGETDAKEAAETAEAATDPMRSDTKDTGG